MCLHVQLMVCTRVYECVSLCVRMCAQVHDATKRELDSLKKQLKEAEEESKTTKDKVSGGISTREFYTVILAVIQDATNDHPVSLLQLLALGQKNAEQAHSVLELTTTNSKQAEEIGQLKLSVKEGEKAKRELER